MKIVKATVALAASAIPTAAMAQANPQGSGPIVSALSWLQGTLLGNVATSVAVIAVAIAPGSRSGTISPVLETWTA